MTTIRAQDTLISSSTIVTTFGRSNATDSSGAGIVSENDRWSDAIDTLLGWHQAPYGMDFDCLNSALDFAVDRLDDGDPPPSSILATEDGEITFEWRSKTLTYIVTILDSGLAEYTLMQDCRVVEEGLLRRDPQTRKLQLEGE